MNKKPLFLLTVFPLLTSCSGFPIAKEDALVVLENIKEAVEEENIPANFTITTTTSSGDNSETNVYIYSRGNKYYHTYSFTDRTTYKMVYESWKFVALYEDSKEVEESKKMKYYIFEIIRNIGRHSIIDAENQFDYTVTYELYKEEVWDEFANDLEEKRIATPLKDNLEKCGSCFEDEEYVLDLKSLNSNSLSITANKEVEVDNEKSNLQYQLVIQNNQLLYVKNESSTQSQETTYKYSVGDIYYPSFEITI